MAIIPGRGFGDGPFGEWPFGESPGATIGTLCAQLLVAPVLTARLKAVQCGE